MMRHFRRADTPPAEDSDEPPAPLPRCAERAAAMRPTPMRRDDAELPMLR